MKTLFSTIVLVFSLVTATMAQSPEATQNKLIQEISSMTTLTKQGKMKWVIAPNGQRLKWEGQKDGKTYEVELAEEKNMRRQDSVQASSYSLIISGDGNKPHETLLQLNSKNEPAYKDALSGLYSEAILESKQSAVNLLDGLLKGM